MKYDRFRGQTPTDHHLPDAEEYLGHPPADAATTELAVSNAINTISALMREERARAQARALPELETQHVLEPAPRHGRGGPKRAGGSGWQPAASAGRSWFGRLRNFRLAPVHGFWAALFLAVMIWPRAVLIAMLAVFVVCLVGLALFREARLRGIGHEIEARVRLFRARLTRSRRDSDPFEDFPDPFERLDGTHRRDRLGS